MEYLIVTVIGGLIVLIIADWLGIGTVKITINHGINRGIKRWKWFVITGWAIFIISLIIGGIITFSSGNSNSSWLVGSLIFSFLGLIIVIIGKIGCWLNWV